MKGIKHKLNAYDELKAVIHGIVQVNQEIGLIALESKVLQMHLVYSIVNKLIIDKLSKKLLEEPSSYNIKLTHTESLALYLALVNWDYEELDNDPWFMVLMQGLKNELDQYVKSFNSQPWKKRENYQLESSTEEYKQLTSSCKRLD